MTENVAYDVKTNNEKVVEDGKQSTVRREISKINNLTDKNELNNLNNTFQQMSKMLENLEEKNIMVMNGEYLLLLVLWCYSRMLK